MLDVIIYQCPRYLLLAPKSLYISVNSMAIGPLFTLNIENNYGANFVFTDGCHNNHIPYH